jgi:hypothetical protein
MKCPKTKRCPKQNIPYYFTDKIPFCIKCNKGKDKIIKK